MTSKKIICENCGNESDQGQAYCAFCGNNLKIQVKTWHEISKKPLPESFSGRENLLENFQQLSDQLQELEKVPAAYQQHLLYFNNLRRDLQNSLQTWQSLQVQTQKEFKDVEDLKKFTWKSLKARFAGNKEEQFKQEEREYLQAVTQEEIAKKDHEDLQNRFRIAENQLLELKALLQRKEALEHQMENVIDQACEGIPDMIEDPIEEKLSQLIKTREPLANQRMTLKNALSHMQNANIHFQTALQKLGSASSLANWDTFIGGGFFVDGMKHSNVSEARNDVQQAYYCLNQAYSLLPNLPRITHANIQELNVFWDVFFDNIFSDLKARRQIEESRASVEQSSREIQNIIAQVNQNIFNIDQQYQQIEAEIKDTRLKLTNERKRMIQEALQKSKS